MNDPPEPPVATQAASAPLHVTVLPWLCAKCRGSTCQASPSHGPRRQQVRRGSAWHARRLRACVRGGLSARVTGCVTNKPPLAVRLRPGRNSAGKPSDASLACTALLSCYRYLSRRLALTSALKQLPLGAHEVKFRSSSTCEQRHWQYRQQNRLALSVKSCKPLVGCCPQCSAACSAYHL